ncbi:3-oxoadipyl-CoA thiolase [bacterium]|nr:3-oxoadipyl-CoA thiolase [bacterium]
MVDAFICDSIRTPIGRYGGGLSKVRADDLAAIPLTELRRRNPTLDWDQVDDVLYGCANQSGEDNRNVARMALLLAGLPDSLSGATINRLCGSGLDATGTMARAIRSGDAELGIVGGVESMTRAPFVMSKSDAPFSRKAEVYDTTLGWRFVNQKMKETYGIDSMGETAENVANEFQISRADQDAFALRSQQRVSAARDVLADEIVKVTVPQLRGNPILIEVDEHPRPDVSLDSLARLKTVFRQDGSVTAGNASGINDGAAAMIVASEAAARANGLEPRARIVAMATAGVPPRIMGFGPAPATRKVLDKAGLSIVDMDVIELNEAFASQSLAVLRDLGVPDDAGHVNPNGGAIALGHPLGMSGVRMALTATRALHRLSGKFALCTMCIGVGQGIAVILERV